MANNRRFIAKTVCTTVLGALCIAATVKSALLAKNIEGKECKDMALTFSILYGVAAFCMFTKTVDTCYNFFSRRAQRDPVENNNPEPQQAAVAQMV